MLLQNKTIMITGASKGIGNQMSKTFAENGASLILLSRNIESLTQLKNEIESSVKGSAVRIFEADVRDEVQVKNVFNALHSEKVFIDVLVNNAGIMKDSTLQMVKADLIDDIFKTNFYGTVFPTQLALKSFLRLKKGVVINMSSIIGTNGNMGQTIYGSSKSAIIGLTKSLSKELAVFNVRVNAIAPGFIDTDMTKGMDPKFYEKNLNSIGMKRIGKPIDVANVALFLASDLSEYVTGQVIGVDGGMVI